MMAILLALILGSGHPERANTDWRSSGCTPAHSLSTSELSAAEFNARHGDIGASVSLECHYLALGEPEKALVWLRQSAEREPLTGRRYINYLLSEGGKENCRKAVALAEKYLALNWNSIELNDSLRAQQRLANECR